MTLEEKNSDNFLSIFQFISSTLTVYICISWRCKIKLQLSKIPTREKNFTLRICSFLHMYDNNICESLLVLVHELCNFLLLLFRSICVTPFFSCFVASIYSLSTSNFLASNFLCSYKPIFLLYVSHVYTCHPPLHEEC